ncbi:MAG: FeoA family protein [Verrucomicrobiales bacterium]|nr:FeoA family protein [Verrucomicrobiales bacterium]
MEELDSQQTQIRLPAVAKGCRAVVVALDGEPSMQTRLRELGLYELAEVKVLRVNGSVMCQVNESRFGIDAKIAENVLVKPLG